MSKWTRVESIEEIDIVGEEILIYDGCEINIDYVECCADTGMYYMANGYEVSHYMPLPEPPKENE